MDNRFNSNQPQAEEESNVITLREAVGVFPDDEHLMAAIDDLEMAEFHREDISVLGSEYEMRHIYNQTHRSADELENDPNAPRGVFVMPEEQSLAEASLVGGGVLLAVFLVGPLMGADLALATNVFVLVALAAIGGLIGFGASRLLRRARVKRSMSQQKSGGLLLWVNTPTHEREEKAQAILSRHGARDVHVNEVVREVAA